MKLSQFKYNLPEGLIAQHPTPNRDESRLMVIDRQKKTIEHKIFKDILGLFEEDDVFILNNTRVFPARLYGNKEKTGAKIEVFLLRELNRDLKLWDVLVDPARKIRVGNKLYFGNDDLVAEVVDNTTSRGRTIRFLFDGSFEELRVLIEKLGETPLPRYIKRPVEPEDKERYQTIFAKEEGAVAVPTAGLHFTRELMMRMEIKGIKFADVTLHCGLGAFREVEVEDLTKHRMDSEYYGIKEDACAIVNEGIARKRKICAVGSSVVRAIESSVSSTNRLNPGSGWTDKFIFPPYDFRIANSFITNFHSTESTLLMLTAAFLDFDFAMQAYQEAIKEKIPFPVLWRRDADPVMKRYAVIVAGGRGERMQSAVPKQFLQLGSLPVLMHTLAAFQAADPAIIITLVLPADQQQYWADLCAEYHFKVPHDIVSGGNTRFNSVFNALVTLPDNGWVAVHDGVRPLVSRQLIERCYQEAEDRGNSVAAISLKDSIRRITDEGSEAEPRESFRLMQTPQVFPVVQLKAAYRQADHTDFTDDASVWEAFGQHVHLVEGDYRNLKITTAEDLIIAAALLHS